MIKLPSKKNFIIISILIFALTGSLAVMALGTIESVLCGDPKGYSYYDCRYKEYSSRDACVAEYTKNHSSGLTPPPCPGVPQ
jgi:hypothetical protein